MDVVQGDTPPLVELVLQPMPSQAAPKQESPPLPPALAQAPPAAALPPAPKGRRAARAVPFQYSGTASPPDLRRRVRGGAGAEVSVEGKPVGRTPRRSSPTSPWAALRLHRHARGLQALHRQLPLRGRRRRCRSPSGSSASARSRARPHRASRARPARRRAPGASSGRRPRAAGVQHPSARRPGLGGRANTGRETPVALGNPLLLPVGPHRWSSSSTASRSSPAPVTITEDGVAKLVNVPLE